MESITSASASASASASESEREFAQFWAVYPKREAKIAARRIWDRLMAKGIDPQAIVDGAVRYAEHREQSIAIDRNDSRKFTAHPATWLNQGRWLDELITPESRPSVIEIAPWDQ
jgi:hypothetical protein